MAEEEPGVRDERKKKRACEEKRMNEAGEGRGKGLGWA